MSDSDRTRLHLETPAIRAHRVNGSAWKPGLRHRREPGADGNSFLRCSRALADERREWRRAARIRWRLPRRRILRVRNAHRQGSYVPSLPASGSHHARILGSDNGTDPQPPGSSMPSLNRRTSCASTRDAAALRGTKSPWAAPAGGQRRSARRFRRNSRSRRHRCAGSIARSS